jgi:hypothetical protein
MELQALRIKVMRSRAYDILCHGGFILGRDKLMMRRRAVSRQ